jgi:hypothetical protein
VGDVLEAAARFLDRYAAGRPVSKDRARILASRLREVGEVPSPCEDCGHNRGPSPLGPPYVICGAAGASHDPAAGCGAWTDRDAGTLPVDVPTIPGPAPGRERCPGCVHASSPTNEPPCLDCDDSRNFTPRREEVRRGA